MRKMSIMLVGLLLFVVGCGEIVTEKKAPELFEIKESKNVVESNVDLDIEQCRDLCGDGYCNEFRCIDERNDNNDNITRNECDSRTESCSENFETCPQDCN